MWHTGLMCFATFGVLMEIRWFPLRVLMVLAAIKTPFIAASFMSVGGINLALSWFRIVRNMAMHLAACILAISKGLAEIFMTVAQQKLVNYFTD